jgi:hypothetical protein
MFNSLCSVSSERVQKFVVDLVRLRVKINYISATLSLQQERWIKTISSRVSKNPGISVMQQAIG